MIIVKSPLRISLGGGGTDLPSYYRDYGGFLVAGAIRQCVYVSVCEPFLDGYYLKYSRQEEVTDLEDIQHPIIREALRIMNSPPRVEITSLADIPSGTGLGSSGSFNVALLTALSRHMGRNLSRREIAELACHIEIDILGEPTGKQDQYIAAFGGITSFTFNRDGSVEVEPLKLSPPAVHDLQEHLLMYFTGFSQAASTLLNDQKSRSEKKDQTMIDNLHQTKEIGLKSREMLERGDIAGLGNLMHEHWLKKKARSRGMSNAAIDRIYQTGRDNGAIGGKLVGAGGRGFVLFVTEDRERLKKAMAQMALREVPIEFDMEGTRSMTV